MEAYIKMKIDYSKLFEKLKIEKITQKEFKEKANINSSTMNKMLHNGNVTTEIICRICDYFHCMPDEFMQFIPDEDYTVKIEERRQKKTKLEKQIAELEQQLKNI